MIIDCAHFVAGVRASEPMSLGDAGGLARQSEGFVWVALNDPAAHEVDELGEAFGVQRSALEERRRAFSARSWSITARARS